MNLLPFSRIYQDLRPPHASAEPCLHLELSPLQSWAQGQCPGTQRTSFWTLGQLFLEDSSVGHITLFPSFFLSYSCLLLQKVVIFILNVEFSKYFLQLAHLISPELCVEGHTGIAIPISQVGKPRHQCLH